MNNSFRFIVGFLIAGLCLSLSSLSFFSLGVQAGCVTDSYGYETCTSDSIDPTNNNAEVLGESTTTVKLFRDVKTHLYKEAIAYVQEKGIVKGYSNGKYEPDNTVNRAEFAKIIIEATFGTPKEPTENCFPDVDKTQWFAKYMCFAKLKGILKGYPDGSAQPGNTINFAETAKIISNTFELGVAAAKEGEAWFTPFVEKLGEKGAIPQTVQKINHNTTRGEMALLIMLLNEKMTDQPSLRACDLILSSCSGDHTTGYGDEFMANVDMVKVRQEWLGWYNTARSALGLHTYKYNSALNRSAHIWSGIMKEKGTIDHSRPGQTEYYDYNMINNWFLDLGLSFENVERVTHSENIGGGSFDCTSGDCTQPLIDGIRSTFDFYMGEVNQDYKPHYNSVMNNYFNEIGLGIVINPNTKKYYLTVHYGTKLL